jgi:hypothetical protein
MPQIIMLNHAAWLLNERRDAKIKSARERGDEPSLEQKIYEGETFRGKPIDQLTSDEYLMYHASAMG